MNHHAFSKILILVILIVLIVGGFFAWQYFRVLEEVGISGEEAYVEVLSPNGGEKWMVGEEYTIHWKTENLPSNAKVLIRIKRDDEGIIGITNDILPQQVEYRWQIDLNKLLCWSWGASCIELNPDEVLKHEFKIEVVAYWLNPEGGNNITITDGSNSVFSIAKKGEIAGPTISCEYKKGEYELRVYDSEGHVTGLVNGVVKQEISRSVYMDGDVTIYFPQDYYEYELFCLKEGNYRWTRSSAQEGEEITFRAINIPISSGATHRYKINWKTLAQAKKGATLLIDDDGDGTFEKTVAISGIDFTCEEFITQTQK